MKASTIIKLVTDSIIRHIKTNIMMVLFFAVTAGIITKVFYVFYSNHYADIKIRELYDKDLDTLYTAYLHVEPLDDEILDGDRMTCWLASARDVLEKRELYKKIISIKGVRGFGGVPEIYKDNEKITGIESKCVGLDRTMIDIHKLKLESGLVVDGEYLDSLGNEYDAIWLVGPDVKGLEAGSVISDGDIIHYDDKIEYLENNADYWKSFENKGTYEGLKEDRTKVSESKIYVEKLERGNQWFVCDNLYGDSYDRVPFELLDDVIVVIAMHKCDDITCVNGEYMLMLDDDADAQVCITKIKELAAEYDCGFTCGSVYDNRNAVNKKKRNLTRLYLEFLVIMLSAGCLLSISIQVTNIISDRKIYGVLYANGAYKRDILFMMVIESIIRTVVGGVIGFYCIYKFNHMETEIEHIAYNDIIRYSIPYLIGILFVIVLVSGIAPYIVLRRYEPADLIEGRME